MIETDYRPARDIDPGWQVWHNGQWVTVEVAVTIRRKDGTERVSWLITPDLAAVDVEADDGYTIRREVHETD